MTIHQMHCGCKLTEKQLVPVGVRQGRICPIHKKSVSFRLTICDLCGNTVKQNKSGILSKFCPTCRIIHRKNLRKGIKS